jgi:hypothetical protein
MTGSPACRSAEIMSPRARRRPDALRALVNPRTAAASCGPAPASARPSPLRRPREYEAPCAGRPTPAGRTGRRQARPPAPAGSGREPWPDLSSDQLATLYLWADRTLPHEPDHPHGVIVDVNPVTDFSGQVYRRLSERTDHETVAALGRIADELGDPWPRTTAARIANALRETQWEPLDPTDIRDILDAPARRVVTNEAQLAGLLIETIDQLATDVRRNPDVAALFWHQQLKSGWIPRWETQFTTLLTDRIRTKLDGVVLRQEVQLNLRYAGTPGCEPDIEAIVPHAGKETSVFVEVKGIWHDEVETAIEHQLADRYLTGARSFTGIYLVAAFASEHWASGDTRRSKARRRNPDTLRELLEDEAERLSTDGKAVHVRVVPFEL